MTTVIGSWPDPAAAGRRRAETNPLRSCVPPDTTSSPASSTAPPPATVDPSRSAWRLRTSPAGHAKGHSGVYGDHGNGGHIRSAPRPGEALVAFLGEAAGEDGDAHWVPGPAPTRGPQRPVRTWRGSNVDPFRAVWRADRR